MGERNNVGEKRRQRCLSRPTCAVGRSGESRSSGTACRSSLVGIEFSPLQDREAAVRSEVSVECDGLPHAKPFHDDEAPGVAERVRLILLPGLS
jgi:hypothetical protein